jgi:hypothetical protein
MKIILKTLLILTVCLPEIKAQKTLQVITKTVREEAEMTGKTLVINLNKSGVKISESTSGKAEITWRIITKHSDRNIAEKESGFIDHVFAKYDNQVIVNYNLKLPRGYGKFKSSLLIEIDVKLPKQALILAKTQLSTIKINGVSNDIKAELKFGKMELTNYSGMLDLTSDFGDVVCQNCSGDLNVFVEKADFMAKNLTAKSRIVSKFGEVRVEVGKLPELQVIAFRSKIYINSLQISDYQWTCRNKFAEIIVPTSHMKDVSKYLDNRLFQLNENKTKPKISVENQYEDIIISNEPISITKK